MSNGLAIAAVSAVLTNLLNSWLVDQDLSGSVGSVAVSALAPDLIEIGAGKPSQINLFLYQVAPNQAWRNAGPPSRDARGNRMANAPLALDLHYLLTAYASQNYHAEILLGYAMQLLHEAPSLARDAIREILSARPPNDGLASADLAEQVEQIKILPQPLNTEELSKLWSAFQSRYRPSAAYQISVVLIEGTRAVRAPQREALTDATLGLTLAESKTLLAGVQERMVAQQAASYSMAQQTCPACGAPRRCKGHHQIVVRSLFGTLRLDSPRFRRCACQPVDSPRSSSPLAECLPERTTPELRYLEAKWAVLLPFGVTVDVLEEVLPLQARVATVYRHTQQVAERLEGELGDEQPFFIEGCQRDWDALSRPDGPLTVGIDGGYVHARDGDNRKAGWFEQIVGKSVPTDGSAKCFGFVTSYDTKPKRRLAELLKAQGLQMNQAITFLSDGGDNVRDLQLYLSPLAEHLLER